MADVEIEGRTIVEVRPMNKKELEGEGWEGSEVPTVIVLDNGVKLYPSCDYEGNGGGALFGSLGNKQFTLS